MNPPRYPDRPQCPARTDGQRTYECPDCVGSGVAGLDSDGIGLDPCSRCDGMGDLPMNGQRCVLPNGHPGPHDPPECIRGLDDPAHPAAYYEGEGR